MENALALSLTLACMTAMLREVAGVMPGRPRTANGEELALAWQRLESSATLPTQGHAFAAALARTLLDGADIEVFRESGALLPLCRDAGWFSRWRMMGAREVFEPGDALCEDGQAAERLAQRLARQGRALSLDRVPADSPFLPSLHAAMRSRAYLSVRPAIPSPTIALDERWKVPEDCFNSGRRSDFRRAARRASELGTVTYEVLAPSVGEFDALFDEAIGVEVASWKKDAGTAIAVDSAKQAFFRTFFRAACADGTFRIAFLRINGRSVAMQMALESLERYWLFKIGYDEEFGKCSPGTLLMLHTIGWAAGRDLAAYELLGDVEPWIAAFWTQDQHDCLRLRTYPYNLRGAVAFGVDALVWLRARLERVRPEPEAA